MRLVCAPLLAWLLVSASMPLPEPAGPVEPVAAIGAAADRPVETLGDLLPRRAGRGPAGMVAALRSDLERGTSKEGSDLERTGSVEDKALAAKAFLATSHNVLDRDRKDAYGDAFHYMWFKKHDPMVSGPRTRRHTRAAVP